MSGKKPNSKIIVILTDDYEVFGTGTGDIDHCLINPTEKLLKLCSKHDVPVTLFADIAEYWAFEEEEKKGTLPHDYIPATKIRNQLTKSVQSGHDVQLHLHPQWLNYSYDQKKGWQVDISLWRLPSLPYGDKDNRKSIYGAIYQSKKTLEDMLKPFTKGYRCIAFRAGAWCIQPELPVITALREVGIRIDSTVAPGFNQDNRLNYYDFREHLNLFENNSYWYVGKQLDDISFDETSLLEVPIFTIPYYFYQRRSRHLKRRDLGLYNGPASCKGKVLSQQLKQEKGRAHIHYSKIMKKIKKQLMVDFTSFSADEMYSAVKKAMTQYKDMSDIIPIVFIGHSKALGDENLKELEKFIVKAKETSVSFGKYEDILRRGR